jgi:hypothetical protein
LNSEETIKTTTSNIRNFINPFTITPLSLFDALFLSSLYHHYGSTKRGGGEKEICGSRHRMIGDDCHKRIKEGVPALTIALNNNVSSDPGHKKGYISLRKRW